MSPLAHRPGCAAAPRRTSGPRPTLRAPTPTLDPRAHLVVVDDALLAEAHAVLRARAALPAHRKSPDRPASANPRAQLRGALSEAAAARWLERNGLTISRGFDGDAPGAPDISVWSSGAPRWGIEVMGAQAAHRALTGACVPPGKADRAARRAPPPLGFLFVSYGPEDVPTIIEVTGFATLDAVRGTAPTVTRVGSSQTFNHSLALASLAPPAALLRALQPDAGPWRPGSG
jgi:hypothetical protein